MGSEKIANARRIHGTRRILGKPLKLALLLTCGLSMGLWIVEAGRATAQSASQESDTRDVRTESIHYPSGEASIEAFLAVPNGAGKHPAVVVIHDSQGLDANTREVARRFAAAGFVAIAPDFLSRAGGAGNKTAEEITQAFGALSINGSVEDAESAFNFLQKYPGVDAGKLSSVGIGWGGWRTFKMAEDLPTLYRAVVFYGSTPAEISDEALHRIHAPVLAHYAQYDFRVTGNYLWTQKQLGKVFTYYIYPGTAHGFFQDGSIQYNAQAAKEAWTRTLDFMRSQGAS